MESEPLSALNLSAWQAKGKKGRAGKAETETGASERKQNRSWESGKCGQKWSPARIYLSELCQLLSVSQTSSSSIDSSASVSLVFCLLGSAWSSNVANVYCISIKSLPRSSSHLLPCHLQVRHLLPHGEKYSSLSRKLSTIRAFKILNLKILSHISYIILTVSFWRILNIKLDLYFNFNEIKL